MAKKVTLSDKELSLFKKALDRIYRDETINVDFNRNRSAWEVVYRKHNVHKVFETRKSAVNYCEKHYPGKKNFFVIRNKDGSISKSVLFGVE